MGFIKMLFFRKEKPKPKKARVSPPELMEQYHSLLGDALNSFEADASSVFREISDSKKEITALLEELRDAELRNQNILPKEKHFMEGNRLAYIRAVEAFILKLNEPDEISDESVGNFLGEYAESSAAFRKSSMRPGQISSQFFGEILKKISAQLSSIEKNIGNLDALSKSESTEALSAIRNSIILLKKELGRNESLAKDIEDAEAEFENIKNERAVFEQRIRNIEKNSFFMQLNEFKDMLKKTEDELKIADAAFIDNFLQTGKALKKFSKNEEDTFISRYIEDPVESVLNDPELRIVEVLDKANEALQKGELEIEERKKDKLIEKLSCMNREMFTRFIINHNDLTLKINDLKRKISNNGSQRELDDTKYKLEHVQKKQETAGGNIKKLNRQMEELKISELKEEIENGFGKFNIQLEIEI